MGPIKEDRLEAFVRERRDEFDFMEPSPEIWSKISNQLTAKPKVVWFRTPAFRAAAVIAILMVSSALIYYQTSNHREQQVQTAAQVDPELRELIEAEKFYAQQVTGKMEEIRKCYKVVPELKMEVEGDLLELESMYNDLKKDLQDNMSNKEVIEAMIENNRHRMKVVDDVLSQINC